MLFAFLLIQVAELSVVEKETPLWQSVSSGMTAADMRRMFPTASHRAGSTVIDRYDVLPSCGAEVKILFPSGSVNEVVVKGRGSLGGGCARKVYEAVVGKYGAPASREANTEGLWIVKEGTTSIWSRDGVTMTFKSFVGQGLVNASWQMTYATNGRKVGL